MTTGQFLLNLFFAALSAFLGVLGGVWWAKRQWKKDRAESAISLRRNLVKALRFNLDRIAQSIEYLEQSPVVVPNFRLDSVTVLQVLLSGRRLFPDEQLFERFSWQRYQLDHLNAKLDYLHNHLAASAGSIPNAQTVSSLQSLLHHLKVTQTDITQLLKEYEATPS